MAMLGDMRELGEHSDTLHRQTGALAAEKCALVLACGGEAKALAEGAGEGALWYADTDRLIAALPSLLQPGDAVLVKASRAMGFEKITQALETPMLP